MRKEQPTYVRFVCYETLEGERSRLGIFQALNEARDSDHAPDWALKEIGELRSWFSAELVAPPRAKLGGPEIGWQSGLSWFKSSADEHIRKMHRLKSALEACGVHVDILTTRKPGIVIFEDRHQIVAKPGAKRF